MLAIAGVAQLVAINARQWIAAQQRATAVREAGNLMEEVFSRPWSDLSANTTLTLGLPDASGSVLPDARVNVAVQPEEATADALRIQIEIDWRNAAGQRSAPVRLCAWRYRSQESTP